MPVIESERLLLKKFSLDDVDGFFSLNNDHLVLKYTGDKSFQNKHQVISFIQSYAHYQKYGYGRWSVYLKLTNEYIGFCGLKYSPVTHETDLGFRLNQKYWGKGYATEAAKLSVQVGFNQYNLSSIIGRTMPANIASYRVLKKLGFKYESELIEQDKSWLQYRLKPENILFSRLTR